MDRNSWRGHFVSVAALAVVLVFTGARSADAAARGAAQVTPQQNEALLALPALETAVFDEQGVPTFLAGRLGSFDPARPERSAFELLAALGGTLRATHREELRPLASVPDELGRTHVRLQQYVDGLPVVGGELLVQVDTVTQEIVTLTGRFLPAGEINVTPALSDHQAALALRAASAFSRGFALRRQPELAIVFGPAGTGRLAWTATAEYVDAAGERQIDRLFVDAETGALLERHPQLHRARNREVWDAQNSTQVTGRVRLIQEGGSSTDASAQDAYTFSGDAWTYFQARHGWDSYDNTGALIRSTVHYDSNYNNAFWDAGSRVLVYGDGDGSLFSSLARARDVVAHEFTHAVTGATAGLVYSNESGALNESMSDVFGAAVEANVTGQGANTWRMGEAVYTPATPGDALRYMNNPTLDGSSYDYYPERYTGSDDNGGVHWNSGIGNLAFFLMSQGGMHPRGKTSVSVRAIGMAAAENIFFRALRFYMTSSTTFAQARQATARAAWDIYGHNSQQHRAVCEAWDAVGVPGKLVGNCLTAGDGQVPPSSVDAYSWQCYGWHDFVWSSAPGATYYEVYASAWSTDFSVAGRIYSGPDTSTAFNVTSNRYIRVKACNASGCGPYSLAYAWAKRLPSCY